MDVIETKLLNGIARSTGTIKAHVIMLVIMIFILCVLAPVGAVEASSTDGTVQSMAAEPLPALISAHEHDATGSAAAEIVPIGDKLAAAALYALRAVYYLLLLLFTGMAMLGLLIPTAPDALQRKLLNKWSRNVARAFLLVALVFVFLHVNQIASSFGGGGDVWLSLLATTSAGQSYIALIVLALLGFPVMRLSDTYRLIWALLLLAAESFNGHAAAAASSGTAIIVDFIHIACSAVWAGGVMLLLLFWRADRKEAARFAERFSAIAWSAIVVLALSGAALTWAIMPSWLYLLYTDWGNWLLAKTVLVLFVIGLGAVLRRRVRRRMMPSGALLKLDGALMAAIVVIVGVLTATSPVPGGDPVNHHEMGQDLHYTLRLSPNAAGPNEASLKLWLPEETGEPKSVELRFLSEDRPGTAAVEAQLMRSDSSGGIAFPGFNEYDYEASRVSLPYPGEWRAEIAVTNGEGETFVRSYSFRND